jgi:uncharacterized protein YfdQ (DUF2303 family)
MSDETNTEAVISLAREAVELDKRLNAVELGHRSVMVRIGASGQPEFAHDIQAAIEKRLPEPLRREGRIVLTELDAFIKVVNRWKVEERTTIYADATKPSLLAVFDEHPSGNIGAGWRSEFTAAYLPPHSPEWKRWTAAAGKEMSQEEFADFLDTNLADVTTIPAAAPGTYPSPVELLEMARNLSIHSSGSYEKKIDTTTGTGTLVIKDEHASYSTKIWKQFPLALRVFERGKHYQVDARIRFRLQGRAIFSFTLHRVEEVALSAFTEIREVVAKECVGVAMYAGAAQL